MRIADEALLVYVINIIGENYRYDVGATHVGRHQSEKSFEMKKNRQMDDFGTGTELRTSLVRGQLEAVMQVKIGTRGTTHSIHSLIKEFQKILQQKEQKKEESLFCPG